MDKNVFEDLIAAEKHGVRLQYASGGSKGVLMVSLVVLAVSSVALTVYLVNRKKKKKKDHTA